MAIGAFGPKQKVHKRNQVRHLAQLKKGKVYQEVYVMDDPEGKGKVKHLISSRLIRIVSDTPEENGGMKVRIIYPDFEKDDLLFPEDVGILPDEWGGWHQLNYLVPIGVIRTIQLMKWNLDYSQRKNLFKGV